jgi:hypothetical protein
MKPILLTLALCLAASVPRLCAAPMEIENAIRIARDHLKKSGLAGQVSIGSATLETAGSRGAAPAWVVRWDAPLTVEGNQREVGLQVAMDGSSARLVERVVRSGEGYVPANRAELSNHRTRSKRPSILDLKH